MSRGSQMRQRRRAALLAVLAALATGCGFHGVYSLPLPGAAAGGGHTYTVSVQFADVLDLVPYSAVKVDAATVGHVDTIRVQGRHALVDCVLPDSVRLPANAIARVEQTSVLGEKFVEIEAPRDVAPSGRLTDGAVIPLARTGTDASVEEVLGALSALLNGGGVTQLHTITHELDVALTGRTGAVRDLLDQLGSFVGGLDDQKAQIVRALDGLDRLSRAVRGQESALVDAVDRMPPALRILADDRTRLIGLLSSVRRLGQVAGHVVTASRADLVANLRSLQPILGRLEKVAQVVPDTLSVLITYPTADSVENEYFGDYGNLALTIDVSAKSLLHTFGTGVLPQSRPQHPGGLRDRGSESTGPTLPMPKLPQLSGGTHWATGTTLDALLTGALS